MRYCIAASLVIAILISFCFGCSSVPAGEKQVSAGEKQVPQLIGLINFPGYWERLHEGRELIVNGNVQYIVRKAPNELVFAVKQGFDPDQYGQDISDFPVKNPDFDYYADNHFAVSLDGKFQARKASESEWANASKPIHSYHFLEAYNNPQFTEQGVMYKDRLYRKTGKSWGHRSALVSPNERWIAVFSFTATEMEPVLIPGFGGGGPKRGEVFLDIYDLYSAEKVAAQQARFGDTDPGDDPSSLIGSSVWIEDRFLIMPLKTNLEICFLAILPDK